MTAAAGGLVAGAIIGGAQWLALRSAGMSPRWVGYTASAMAAGSALAATLTGAGTEVADVMLWGLVTGATVGAAQSALLATGPRFAAAWTAANAAGWSLGWLVTSAGHRRHRARPPRLRRQRRAARDASSPGWCCGSCAPPGPPRP